MYYGFELQELPKILNFYSVTRNTVWEITDKSNIIIIISDGECEITCDGEAHILKPGDLFFIPANHSYTRKPVGSSLCTMTYIHFEISDTPKEYTYNALHELLSNTKNQLNEKILRGEQNLTNHHFIYLQSKNSTKSSEKISNILKEIHSNFFNRSIASGVNASVLLCLILAILSEENIKVCLLDSSLAKSNKFPKKLKSAISYILQNYSSPITLNDLSEYCNISKQQLIRYFKSELNTTPLNYITNYKISRAKELLFNHPELSIGEISNELGFENQHYFSTFFTKTTGETPSYYRYRTLNYDRLKEKNE